MKRLLNGSFVQLLTVIGVVTSTLTGTIIRMVSLVLFGTGIVIPLFEISILQLLIQTFFGHDSIRDYIIIYNGIFL